MSHMRATAPVPPRASIKSDGFTSSMAHCNHSYRSSVNLSYRIFSDDCYMVEMHRVGTYIRRKREALGLSQDALARQLGVSRVAITKWESGVTKNLKQANLSGLSAIFGVSLEELLRGPTPYCKAAPRSLLRVAESAAERAAVFADPTESVGLLPQREQPDVITEVVSLLNGMSAKKRAMVAIFARVIAETEIP